MPAPARAGRSSAAPRELLAAAEARAAALRGRIGPARAAVERAEAAAQKGEAEVAELQGRLGERQELSRAAHGEALAREERVAAVLEGAASEIREVSKKQLEEVRALSHPPVVVRRALSLVYCALYPREAEQLLKSPGGIAWRERIVPMMKRDDFTGRLEAFPPADREHPFLASHAIMEFIESQVAEAPAPDPRLAGGSGHGGAAPESAAPESDRVAAQATQQLGAAGTALSAARLLRGHAGDAAAAEEPAEGSAARGGGAAGPAAPLPSGAGASVAARRARRERTVSLGDGESDRLTPEAVTFASQAVGVLFCWLLAQLRCARSLAAEGADRLEAEAAEARARGAEAGAREASAALALEEALASAALAEAALAEARAHARQLEDELAGATRDVERLRGEITAAEAAGAAEGPLEVAAAAAAAAELRMESDLAERAVCMSRVEVEVRERVVFGKGSSEVASFATRSLHGVANIMQRNGDVKLLVEGYSRADEEDDLSTQRANRVMETLVAQGVPAHRLRATGFGCGGDPAGDGRVEFSVIQEISVKGTVQFGPCSDHVTGDSGPILDSVAALLAARPCLHVRVEGHTDNAPFFGSNLELAQSRASSVARELGERGLDPARLVPAGFGDELPRASNGTREGRARNRRVEFHVLQRETIGGLWEPMRRSQGRGQIDGNVLRHLARTACGAGVQLALPIRAAAADLLRRMQADWAVQRLLFLASRHGDPSQCPLAALPEDCVHRVVRMYFLLGCSPLSQAQWVPGPSLAEAL